MSHDPRHLQAVLRTDLTAFTEKSFRHLHPNAEYYDNWHIRAIVHALERCTNGEIKRLIITLPPRHLKSHCASIAYPAWVLGQDPSCNVVCVSYSNELSAKLARDCRSIMEAEWYKATFRGTRISRRKNTETEFETTRNGGRLATSIEGTLTGRGGRYLIIDDPIKPDLATMSEAERQRVNAWFRRTAYTRLDNRNDGVIIIIMQRVHEDDLVGNVFELDGWTKFEIPAIAERQEEYRIGRASEDVWVRRVGDVIDPRRMDAAELKRIETMLGTYNFAAQYQQNPLPVTGNLVKREWFRYYAEPQDRDYVDAVVLSLDTATAAGELNDFSVCTVWDVVGQNYYLRDVMREKLDYPDLRRRVLGMVRQYGPDFVLIEKASTGTALAQELRTQCGSDVRALPAPGDKQVRFAARSAVIEQRRLWLPENAPWLNEFLKELLAFPGAKHDDQVDSVELFLRFASNYRRDWMQRPQGHEDRPSGMRPDSSRSTRFNARRYLDELLRGNRSAPSVF